MHGTRAAYRAGCSCVPCRAAEAAYRASIRQQHRQGRPPLGARISAVEARRLIRSLKAEHFTERQIAQEACGERYRNPLLQRPAALTVRRLLQIKRYARLKLGEALPQSEGNV